MRAEIRMAMAGIVVCAAGFCVPAMAQSWTYGGFTQATPGAAITGLGNSYSQVSGSTKLTVTAFGQGSGSAFSAAYVGNYGTGSGFGVGNATEGGRGATSPQHSMDNSVGIDMLALHFTNTAAPAVDVGMVMTTLAIGWHNTAIISNCGANGTTLCGTDSDVSLLRWTKTTAPTILGGTTASLLTAGWQLVNHYDNMVDGVDRSTGANAILGSSWWLISAYSSAWGTGSNTANLSDGDDFVKVMSSITTVPVPTVPGSSVPEPASLALVGVALLGAFSSTRRRNKST